MIDYKMYSRPLIMPDKLTKYCYLIIFIATLFTVQYLPATY